MENLDRLIIKEIERGLHFYPPIPQTSTRQNGFMDKCYQVFKRTAHV